MVATVAQLGARVLRKCGLTPVAVSAQPSHGSTVTVTLIANRALRLLGVNTVAAASQPTSGSTVTLASVGAEALRLLGVNPVDAASASTPAGTTTITALGTDALRRLAVIAAAETPSTEDAALALAVMGNVHQIAAQTAMVTWANTAVPLYAAEPYIAMGMALLRPAFGMQGQEGEFAAGLAGLSAEALAGTTGAAKVALIVDNVHQTLNGLGLVTWLSSAIPMSAASHYATMAAVRLAPTYGKAMAEELYVEAIGFIKRYSLAGAAGQALAETEVNAAHQVLNSLGYVTWTTLAIPESVAGHYAVMAATRLSQAHGTPMPEDGYAGAVGLVRQFAMSGATGQAIAEEKVRAVHMSFDARNLTRWDLLGLPDYAEEPYVLCAAELAAGELGQPPLPGLYLAGEREIRKVISTPPAHVPVVFLAY